MTTSDEQLEELRKSLVEFRDAISDLRSDVRDLHTHVEYLKQSEEERRKRLWAVTLAAIGSFITTVVVFITRGGLNGQ